MALNDAWDVLMRAATHSGDSVAYFEPSSHKTLTYSQLLGQSSRLASWLHSRGVRRGDRIAVMLNNCIEAIQLHFAAAAVHAIVVNINTHWVDREVSLVLQDSSPQFMFVHPQYLATVQAAMEFTNISAAVPATCRVDNLILVDSAANIASQPLQTAYTAYSTIIADCDTNVGMHRPTDFSDSDGYEMYYTSGTTGRPKGVVLSQHIVVQHALGTIKGRYCLRSTFAQPMICAWLVWQLLQGSIPNLHPMRELVMVEDFSNTSDEAPY